MLDWMIQAILVLGILGAPMSYDDDLIVTPSGPIRGTTVKGFTGKDVNVFYGIPYAEPPIGHLRFRPPVEIKPWTEQLDATVRSLACYQKVPPLYKKNIAAVKDWVPMRPWTEDCVKLHIWVPKPRPQNAAVMVYIHGGGFGAGDPEQPLIAGATLAAEENIITVSMNYRLDVLGFLYLGIPEAPGNVGVLDQQMALQWIQKNIASFGGNPDRVTIQGISAGGASVGYHLLAPSSRGLFKNAILMSGTANAEWSLKRKEKTLANSLDLARTVGCLTTNLTAILQCLQSVHPEHFLEWNPEAFSFDNNSLGVGPTVDGHFLPDFPTNLLRQGMVNEANVMIGLTANDGASFLFSFYPEIFSAHPDGRVTPQQFESIITR